MSKLLKFSSFSVILMGAGYFFGTVCDQINQAYVSILSPPGDLLDILLWFLAALFAVAVAAGLIAVLLRPVGVAILAFALSGATLLLGWQISIGSGILVLVYLIAACFYVFNTTRELNDRVRFSTRPVSLCQGILLNSLVLVACGSLYFGCSEYIEREGFSIPEKYTSLFTDTMKDQILAGDPDEVHEEIDTEIDEQLQSSMNQFMESTVKPYEQYIPLAIAAGFLAPLITITSILAVVPTAILGVIFRLLISLGIVKVTSETREVQKLVIE